MKKLLTFALALVVLAVFTDLGVAQQTFTLEVDVVSPFSTANITVTPIPGFISTPCPPSNALTCTTQYPAGTQVTVTATSGTSIGWIFTKYVSGPPLGAGGIGPITIVSGCVWPANTCTFKMPASPLEVHLEIIGPPPPPTSCQDDLTSGKLTITGPNVSSISTTSANLSGTVSVNPIPPGCTYQAKLVWEQAPVSPPFANTLATGSIPPGLLTLSGTASPLNPSSGYGARIEVTKACAGQATTCDGPTKFFETPKGEGGCDLEIKKSLAHMAQHPPFQTGQQVAFEIYVTNQGTGTCSAPISVTDNFSQGLTYVSGGTSGWVCPPGSITGSGSVTCTYSQPIAPSQTSMFLVSYTVTGPPPNVVGNCVIVKHPNDSNQANNRTCIEVPVEKPKAVCTITITKKTGPVASPPFPFTVTGPPASSFTLTNGQSHTVTVPCASPSNPSVAASYTVTETPVPGWAPTNITCGLTSGTMSVPTYTGNSAQFQVGLTGSNVQCTFTNTPIPPACTITITKKTNPAGGTGFSFSSAWSGLQGITLNDGQSISKPVPCGPIFNVFETPKPGWAPTNITCTFTGGTGNFKILGATTGATNGFESGDNEVNFDSLTSGANLQCAFTNTQCKDVQIDLSTGKNPNWTVSSGTAGTTTPVSSWVQPSGGVQWIQPSTAGTPQKFPGGIYTYSVPFNIPGPLSQYSSILLTGKYAADNSANVKINSSPGASCSGGFCFSSWHPLSITTGFLGGINTLGVAVDNAFGSNNSNPTGLVVDATLRAICKK